jgi:hypothetical protein
LASAVAAAEPLRAHCWQQQAPGTFFGSCKNIFIVKPKPKQLLELKKYLETRKI